MPFASGSEVRVAHIAEATWGTTPATPAFKVARVTSGGGRTNKTTGTSAERQADRNVRDLYMLGQDAVASYNFELTYGTFDDWLESALSGAWAANVLKNGVTRKFFTLEETLELGATDSFSRFVGSEVNSLSLDVAARAAITGSFAFMSKQESLATAIIAGATYTAPNTKPTMTASAHVSAMTVGSISPPVKVRRISLQVANNLRTRPEVGSLYSAEFGPGRCEVTGTLEAYFESNALYQEVLNHGSAAVSFIAGVVTAEKYRFTLPKMIFGDGERAVGGNDDDVMVNIPFQAVFDTTEACSIKIERAIA